MILMKNEKIYASWQKISPSEKDSTSMLAHIIDKNESINKKQEKSKTTLKMALIASLSIMMIVVVFWGSLNRKENNVAYTIYLDVNPSVEIEVDESEIVTRVSALNDDARLVIEGYHFIGYSLETTTVFLIDSMVKNGYLNNSTNSILISIKGNDKDKNEKLQEKLNNKIDFVLQNDNIDGAILSQAVYDDDKLNELAEKNGISLGKAKLINKILDCNSLYTFENLVSLTINELNLIASSKKMNLEDVYTSGNPSSLTYISKQEAIRIALDHAGFSETEVDFLEIEFDWNNGHMVYEVEFEKGKIEYEYDINALTGEIDDYSNDLMDDIEEISEYIGKEKAVKIALDHARISENEIYNLEVSLDNEKGIVVYEVEFNSGEYEYEYDVNALTGAVEKSRKEMDD